MQPLFLGIAALTCPIGMGLMMWMMMRGRHENDGDAGERRQEVAELRAEIDQLKAQNAQNTPTDARPQRLAR
jgi:hypothetical protein